MILPGLSAGTVILILGFYRQLLEDLSSFNIKPYMPVFFGGIGGILVGVTVINFLLTSYHPAIMAFLLGMLLASVPAVLNYRQFTALPDLAAEVKERKNITKSQSGEKPGSAPVMNLSTVGLNALSRAKKIIIPLCLGFTGFLITWFIICEPTRTFTVFPHGGAVHYFVGGFMTGVTILLPGISGSAILIILDLYESAIYSVATWQWPNLFILAAGFAAGLFGLARLLSALYRRYQAAVSFFLAGLIIGSTRVLLPEQFTPAFFIFAPLGILFVLYITRKSRNLS